MEEITESKNDKDDLPNLTRDGDTTTDDFVHGTRLVALAASLMLGMFLVALDNVRPCDNSWNPQQETDDTGDRRSSARQSRGLPPNFMTSTRYHGMVLPTS
jgi:hypothetical protein